MALLVAESYRTKPIEVQEGYSSASDIRFTRPWNEMRLPLADMFSTRLIAAGGLQRNRRQSPIQIVKLLGCQRGIEQMREVFVLNGILDGVIKIG